MKDLELKKIILGILSGKQTPKQLNVEILPELVDYLEIQISDLHSKQPIGEASVSEQSIADSIKKGRAEVQIEIQKLVDLKTEMEDIFLEYEHREPSKIILDRHELVMLLYVAFKTVGHDIRSSDKFTISDFSRLLGIMEGSKAKSIAGTYQYKLIDKLTHLRNNERSQEILQKLIPLFEEIGWKSAAESARNLQA